MSYIFVAADVIDLPTFGPCQMYPVSKESVKFVPREVRKQLYNGDDVVQAVDCDNISHWLVNGVCIISNEHIIPKGILMAKEEAEEKGLSNIYDSRTF